MPLIGLYCATKWAFEALHESLAMERGDPRATPEAVFQLVDAPEPPLRLILGRDGLPWIRGVYVERIATWKAWEAASNAAQSQGQKSAAAAS